MLYIPNIVDYLKFLTNKEVKGLVIISFGVLNLREKHCILYKVKKLLEKLLDHFIHFKQHLMK